MKPMMLVILLFAAAVFIGRIGMAASHSERVLAPDLAFHFVCGQRDRSALENDIEKFLTREGFRVLNHGRLQREHNVRLLETNIVGLDDRQRIVNFTTLPPTKGKYTVGLLSRPPTQHSPLLEEALLVFAKEKLKCAVEQISRNENGPEPLDFFNREVKRIEGYFRQAEELQGSKRL